jgi:hypothetical protein
MLTLMIEISLNKWVFAWDVAAVDEVPMFVFACVIHRHGPSLAQQQLLLAISGGTRLSQTLRHLPVQLALSGTNHGAARATFYWLLHSASIA